MEQDVRKRAFSPEVGLFRRRPESSEKWWTPIASVDLEEHSPHNIALTACGLGIVMGFGVCAAVAYGWTSTSVFSLYVAIVALYHMLEYLGVALYNPSRTELGSFMFNPDGDNRYTVAMAVSVAEYFIECWVFGRTKEPSAITLIGLVMAIIGQIIRTLAMVTAKASFNHYVATRRAVDHQLITHGVYRYERHPSYVGFFLWAVGLQTMLKNVIATVLFIVALGYFFTKRTRKEEAFLLNFFGNKYQLYKDQTPSLIPVAAIGRISKTGN
ncbi:ICMT-domain-containing protein [Coemansia reversa NRRL 1564]|uniref:Protein-S-isoprenylcysteine O-methyltransferase n=1 Tax=Coemansia reversa (strain ATCC 12441 / NRRL 1564) TaxID=763665 RepID=A0A2G5BA41_COERN|nr:ICMT-domain-containing protein [Coemansia reversa NRRL 1564]|eukprot:PIA15597.1 ICMT-domain-containing protein [Coemansia reversa NRRL 1564]